MGKKIRLERGFDIFGILSSSTCAIHCISLPFFVTLFPFVGMSMAGSYAVECLFILFAIISASGALPTGYRLHKRLLPFGLFSFGIAAVVFFGMQEFEWSRYYVIVGSISMASSHFLNFFLSRKSVSSKI